MIPPPLMFGAPPKSDPEYGITKWRWLWLLTEIEHWVTCLLSLKLTMNAGRKTLVQRMLRNVMPSWFNRIVAPISSSVNWSEERKCEKIVDFVVNLECSERAVKTRERNKTESYFILVYYIINVCKHGQAVKTRVLGPCVNPKRGFHYWSKIILQK